MSGQQIQYEREKELKSVTECKEIKIKQVKQVVGYAGAETCTESEGKREIESERNIFELGLSKKRIQTQGAMV